MVLHPRRGRAADPSQGNGREVLGDARHHQGREYDQNAADEIVLPVDFHTTIPLTLSVLPCRDRPRNTVETNGAKDRGL